MDVADACIPVAGSGDASAAHTYQTLYAGCVEIFLQIEESLAPDSMMQGRASDVEQDGPVQQERAGARVVTITRRWER